VVGCSSQPTEHNYNPPIKTHSIFNSVHAFNDPGGVDTYVLTQHTGDTMDGLRRAEDFFHGQEQYGAAKLFTGDETVFLTAYEEIHWGKVCKFHEAGDDAAWWALCSNF